MQSSEAISPLIHSWLRKVRLAYIPGPTTPLLESFVIGLLESFRNHGREVENQPGGETDVLLTTAEFGEALSWRRALLFTGRRRLHLDHLPTLFTLVHATPTQFRAALAVFDKALAKEPPNPADYELPGMAATAYHTLHEQGRRGGPILSLIRMVQSQAKCIRIILVIGEDDVLQLDVQSEKQSTTSASPLPTPTIQPVPEPENDAEFTGAVEVMASDMWVVGGRAVAVTAATEIKPGLEIAVLAKVHAVRQADGSLWAREIEAAGNDDQGNSNSNGDDDHGNIHNGNVNSNDDHDHGNVNTNADNGNDDHSNGNVNSNDDNGNDDHGNGNMNSNDDNGNDDHGGSGTGHNGNDDHGDHDGNDD